jgi:hypothetical protein
MRGLGITELQHWVVVECEVLSLLVLTPDLLALNTEDLDSCRVRSAIKTGGFDQVLCIPIPRGWGAWSGSNFGVREL